jgi:hypothetical protein
MLPSMHVPAIEIECPTCRASAGQRCSHRVAPVSSISGFHDARQEAADRAGRVLREARAIDDMLAPERDATPNSVACPTCYAPAGERCRLTSSTSPEAHEDRCVAAMRATPLDLPCEPCGAAPRYTCRERARLGAKLWCSTRAAAFEVARIACPTCHALAGARCTGVVGSLERVGALLWCEARARIVALKQAPIAHRTMAVQIKVDATEFSADEAIADVLLGFTWAHLPPERAEVSRRFGELAAWAAANLPHNRELAKALDALLVAKDAAVRASMRPVAKVESAP